MASSVVLLPCAPASVAVARRELSVELSAAGIFDAAVCDAVLVVSELLSNAILHAYPLPGAQIKVAWSLDNGSIEVAVSDGGGSTRPHAGDAAVSSLGGRGLAIVAHLCSTWGVRTEEIGITVWAVLPAPKSNGRAAPDGIHNPDGAAAAEPAMARHGTEAAGWMRNQSPCQA